MVYLGLEPGKAGWWAQTNQLSYGSTPSFITLRYVEYYLRHLLQK